MSDQSEHSLLSASAAPRWTRCYGSIALESTQPNNGSSYAAEGTAAHALAAWLLGGSPKELAHLVEVPLDQRGRATDAVGVSIEADGQLFVVDEAFAADVQRYVDYVEGLGGYRMVEVKVNYANWLGVPEKLAWGTSDDITVYLEPRLITIDPHGWLCSTSVEGSHTGRLIMTDVDLKFGKGVAVYPENNEQGMLYAAGALNEIDMLIDVRDDDIIEIVIHQPRIGEGAPQSWYITVGALKRWLRGEAATAAAHAVNLYNKVTAAIHNEDENPLDVVQGHLTPGEKQCRFCNAKAICPALAGHAQAVMTNDFVDLDAAEVDRSKPAVTEGLTHVELADKLGEADLLEAYAKSVLEFVKTIRSKAESALLAGEPVPGYKLVRGKKGDRKWVNAEQAIKKLKTVLGAKFALKPPEPISPTQVEDKFVKPKKISARQWAALQALITQAEGGISIAPVSDKRETYNPAPTTEAFPNLEEDADDLSALA